MFPPVGQVSRRRAIQRGSQEEEEEVSRPIVKGSGNTAEWRAGRVEFCFSECTRTGCNIFKACPTEHEKVHNMIYDFKYKNTITSRKKIV